MGEPIEELTTAQALPQLLDERQNNFLFLLLYN